MGEGVGRKKLKRPGLCGGKEKREREKRNLPPLSLCRPTQPQPGHPRPRFVRYKLFARIPKPVLSPFRSPQPNSPAAGSFARQGGRRGLVLGLGLGFSFLLLVFLRLLPVAHDLRHATTLVSRLHSRLFFFLSLLPSFYEVDSTKKKGDLYKKIRRKKYRRFRGGI